jgi:hypothetical protein
MSEHDGEQAFLGEEFLTWLWFRIETEGGEFELGGESIAVVLDDFLAFAPLEADATEQSLRKGLPTRTPEARAALRSGRRLRRAKLLVARGSDEWTLVLDGPTLGLRSIKVPADGEEETTAADRRSARVQGFLDVHDIVFGLYERFLEERLTPEYLGTVGEAQAQWMHGA